jgi:hypothetical protein
VLPRTSDIEHGRFEFQNIPPGFYTLSVRPAAETFVSVTVVNGQLRRAPPPPARVGSVSIVVGATPPLPVVIATSFGSTLAGRIELEGAADGVTPASFQLAAYPADNTGGTPGGSIARIGDDWSFQMAGMGQPSWFSFTGPPGWWMKSLTFGGMDAADRVVPFGQPDDSHSDAVAVFSRTAGEITGAVADGAQAVMNYLVVVFPIDPAGWRQESQFVKVGRPNQSGQYSIVVPPGEYLITAVDAAGALGRQMLTTLVPFSEHIVVGGNERVQKNLRLNRP